MDRPAGSEPGYDRPLLIVSSDEFNHSRISTVLAAALTTNLTFSGAPGNVFVSSEETGLPWDSVVNVSQIVTVDKNFLITRSGSLGARLMSAVESGLRSVLDL